LFVERWSNQWTDGDHVSLFEPIKKIRASDQVASRLRGLILSGHYQPGDRLPPERKLAADFGVTRTTLREALHTLAQHKLLRILPGEGAEVIDFWRHAGLDLLEHLALTEDGVNVELLENLFEARTLLGSEVAALAAQRATPEDLAQLERGIASLRAAGRGPEELQRLDFDFFHTLARISRNLVYLFVLNAIRPMYFEHAAFFEPMMAGPEEIAEAHAGAARAIATADPEAARRCVRAYLEAGRERLIGLIRPAEAAAGAQALGPAAGGEGDEP
jgi:GntR family transcriptional repressor for pyruvate dehydrogenase complex